MEVNERFKKPKLLIVVVKEDHQESKYIEDKRN